MSSADYLLFGIFVGYPIALVIVVICLTLYKKKKQEKTADIEKDENEVQIEMPSPQFLDAKVISKKIYKQFNGVRLVKSTFCFLITFQTVDGELIELPVSQEYFEKINEGQKGTLVIVNGNFFDFGEGEECSAECENERSL